MLRLRRRRFARGNFAATTSCSADSVWGGAWASGKILRRAATQRGVGGERAYEDQLKKEMPPLPRISGGVRW